MDSQVPFEGLLEPDFEEVAFGQDCFHQVIFYEIISFIELFLSLLKKLIAFSHESYKKVLATP